MAKSRYRKPKAVKIGETPTPERRLQNGGLVAEIIDRDVNDTVLVRRYRAVWECPLDVYRDHKVINEVEHRAGIRFREAYFASVLSRGATAQRLNPRPASTGLTMNEKILRQALDLIPPHTKEVVIDICGHDIHIWNAKAHEKLRKGLGSLAIKWHMAAIEVCDHKKEK